FFAGIVVTACSCGAFLTSLPPIAGKFTRPMRRPSRKPISHYRVYFSNAGICCGGCPGCCAFNCSYEKGPRCITAHSHFVRLTRRARAWPTLPARNERGED